MHQFILQFYNLRCVLKRFAADRCLSRAAELSFTTLLSIVPLTMVGLVIFTIFPKYAILGDKAQEFIFAHFVPATGQVIQNQLNVWVQKTIQLSWLSIISLLVTAIFVLFTIESAFNAIWRIKKSRHFIEGFFLYWGMLTLAPLLLGACMLLFAHASAWSGQETGWHSALTKKWLSSSIMFIITTLWFTLLYRLLPNRASPIKYCFIAGTVAALLFELARQAFAFYIDRFSIYTLVYGALAAIPIFLLWLYLSWTIVLWGAELLQILPYWRTPLPQRKQNALSRALLLLKTLHENKYRYNYEAWLKHAPGDALNNIESLEEQLEKAGIIACVHKKIKLTVDLSELTLYQLMEAIYYPSLKTELQHLANKAVLEVLQRGLLHLQEDWNMPVLKAM
ncbi:MAG: rane protein [Gammaproteobacteria bacterium]|nr:rane protein [Gammaproteobacteria bacterium]